MAVIGCFVDVFTVDVGCGGRGRIVSPAVGVSLFETVEFEPGLEFAEETDDGRFGEWGRWISIFFN